MELTTRITKVTVYPDRARVTRSGAATLEAGEQALAVAGLPAGLDPASVRASARGTARARLLGVDVRKVHHVATPQAQVRALETQVEAAQDALDAIETRTARLQEERATLRSLAGETATYARGFAWGKITASDQMALLDTLRERTEALDAALHEAAQEQRAQERELSKLKKDLHAARGARGTDRYTANVAVEVTEPGELTVELTYVLGRAGWTPIYDLRLLEEGDAPSLSVGYMAEVQQRTGEAWDEIGLTLSTARPALAETLPELQPWYIAPYTPPQARARKRMAPSAPKALMTVGAMADDVDSFTEEEREEAPVDVVVAQVETSGTAVTYRVPATVSVPGDGEAHKVTVALFPLEPALDYVSAPKRVEAAYRRAKVSNESAYTLLPGAVNLFAGDEFIGRTEIALTAPGGEIELYLGVDDRVKVTRELVQRDVDKRLVRDRRRLRYAYEITLENLLPTEARVTVHDQIPTPRHESIKAKLESAEPAPAEESEMGLLRWELSLAPKSKQTVRFEFSVEHPRDMRVTGLP